MPYCPRCGSKKVILNGHYHKGKPQFLCSACRKFFYENAAKGYPPTAIPFPIISYLLYFHKRIPTFSNTRKFRKFVNQWLKCLDIRETDVSRHTITHWIKHYTENLESIISFHEAQDYCRQLLLKKIRDLPKADILRGSIPHTQALALLEKTFGKSFCLDLNQKDQEFFQELCDLTSKYPVYCSQLLEEKITGGEQTLSQMRL